MLGGGSSESGGPPAPSESLWQSVVALGVYTTSLRREPGRLAPFSLFLVCSALSGRRGGSGHDGDGEAEPEQGDARGLALRRGAASAAHGSPGPPCGCRGARLLREPDCPSRSFSPQSWWLLV